MRYLLRRIGFLLFTGWAALSINFIVPHLMPGNPAQVMLAKFQGRLSPPSSGCLTEAFDSTRIKACLCSILITGSASCPGILASRSHTILRR